MELLHKKDILARLSLSGPDALHIDPLLDERQVGEVTVDLRLGTEFLVSVLTRRSHIGLVKADGDHRGVSSFFRATRRDLGDRFILYPNQVVLSSTLEYVGLPSDIYIDVLTRNSFNRMGIGVNTMVQPGYRGCISVELFNHGNNPVELVVGSRIYQARMFQIKEKSDYNAGEERRKYFGNIRPSVSLAANDDDLKRLVRIRRP